MVIFFSLNSYFIITLFFLKDLFMYSFKSLGIHNTPQSIASPDLIHNYKHLVKIFCYHL